MNLGILRERAAGDRRVALVPEMVAELTRQGHRVLVERQAGVGAYFADAAYREAGAQVVDEAADVVRGADVWVCINLPPRDLLAGARPGTVLVGLLAPMAQARAIEQLAAQGLAVYSLDAMPRISRAQGMDVLSAMGTVSGYRAIIVAAQLVERFFPLLMTAAGTVRPARVLVLGAGVAGLQAVATARRLGAVVQAFDARPIVQEQVESLGAGFLTLPALAAEGAGGYARALAADEEARERELLAGPVSAADVVVTTAMVPGRRAPLLISEDMVASMPGGAVIMDLAAPTGGNCAVTVPGQRVVVHDVIVDGSLNLAAEMPNPASRLYSRNLVNFLALMVAEGLSAEDGGPPTLPDPDRDEILSATAITREGRIVHRGTVEARERLADPTPQGGA
ncbi:MAG: NAD(P) transhydrogenase subunit alpha [Thermaerobacter sp.]|nr:NAD(P) transhydrogenase subunit alpha [Thermaerobacter sp.]